MKLWPVILLAGCDIDLHDDDCELPDDADVVPLDEAKLNIEHNATDADSGFQGFIDSEGWACLDVIGPDGDAVLALRGEGSLGELGLTELFFESVEPENADIPLDEVLQTLPEGDYVIEGLAREAGEDLGIARGVALLTHDIPAAPVVVAPPEDAVVPLADLVVDWEPVTETLDGGDVTIVAYQLTVEKADEEPHPNAILGGYSVYVGADVTRMTVPAAFLEPGTAYVWEVLAIEESGNQTITSGSFSTP